MENGARQALEPARHPGGSRTVAVARHAIPSRRPGKSQPLGRRRLDGDAADVEAGDPGDAGAHRFAMRADLRRLANERRIEADGDPAARANARRRMGEEHMRSRALPLRVRRREMGADVAFGERAVDRVGKRVQRDVRVGVAAQRLIMRHLDAAKPDMVAGREGVDVEPLPDARLARCARDPRFRGAEILHRGHLAVPRIALEHVSRRARPFGDRNVVGHIAGAFGRRPPVGLQNEGETKRLRRLHGAERRARRGCKHAALPVNLFDRVAERRSGRRSAMVFGGADSAGDELAGGKGARRVVDEDDVGLRLHERLEPGEHALLPRRAADRRRTERSGRLGRQMRQGLFIEGAVFSADGHDSDGKRPRRRQRVERMGEERLAGAEEILLRPLRAEPRSATGGDDDERDFGQRHVFEAPGSSLASPSLGMKRSAG